ncbi:MAG: AAA family ATPase [Chloroflexi bacterium]|nr:AAA family ATPase [Chloroflexota bacterium]
MSIEQGKWQKALKEERLPHQLRVQSRQIDQVLMQSETPGQVAGGVVTNRHIQFNLQSHLETGLERLRGLKQDFLTALGVEDVQFIRENGQFRLKVQRPETPPVALLEILSLLPELTPVTATLGLAEDGRPVLLELSDADLSHVLLVGDSQAGKTALLRTIAVSLALSNKQSQMQLLIINAQSQIESEHKVNLDPLTYLPHLLEPVVADVSTGVDVLQFLAKEAKYRIEQNVKTPTIVVLIDHVVSLLEKGGQKITDALLTLTQKGAAAGIHLVLTTHRPDSEKLESLIKANLPVRIVGRTDSEVTGVAATGKPDTHSDYLYGEGDFLAVTGDVVTHFQAAYIGDYDLHLTLDRLHRNRPKSLLAQPFDDRAVFEHDTQSDSSDEPDSFVVFSIEEDNVVTATPDEKQVEDFNEIPFDAGDVWFSEEIN